MPECKCKNDLPSEDECVEWLYENIKELVNKSWCAAVADEIGCKLHEWLKSRKNKDLPVIDPT